MTLKMVRADADVFHVGTGLVNWVIARDGRDLTLIDSGYPGDLAAVEESITRIGHRMGDIRALLITHCHVDHVGSASHLARRYGIPVHLLDRELPQARSEHLEQATPLDVARRAWRPRVARWALRVIRAGGTSHPTVPEATALPPAGMPTTEPATTEPATTGALDLPGRPIPLPTPGHTSGHCAYLLPDAGAVISGDPLITGHPTVGRVGPQLLPAFFAHSPADTIAGLDILGAAAADLLLPGHGAVWRGEVRRAVELARDDPPSGYV